MAMEDHRLNDDFELATDQRIGVLHDVSCTDRWGVHAERICGLQMRSKEYLLIGAPRGVQREPCIFDDPEKDRVEEFNR